MAAKKNIKKKLKFFAELNFSTNFAHRVDGVVIPCDSLVISFSVINYVV